jgi:hypothetical protein
MTAYKIGMCTLFLFFSSQLSAQQEKVEKEKTTTLRNTCGQCVKDFWQKEKRKITVYITFTINPDSSVTNARVTRSLCPACNDDAMKTFSKMTFYGLVQSKAMEYVHPIRILVE